MEDLVCFLRCPGVVNPEVFLDLQEKIVHVPKLTTLETTTLACESEMVKDKMGDDGMCGMGRLPFAARFPEIQRDLDETERERVRFYERIADYQAMQTVKAMQQEQWQYHWQSDSGGSG